MIRELFSENSSISSMRVMSMIALLMACGIAIFGIYCGTELSQLSVLVGLFLSAAFGGKLLQKVVEARSTEAK